jgi:putative aldouronate transport system permease protein
MLLPAIAFVVIFNYAPIYGLQVAFKNFNVAKGFVGSPWVGLKNFQYYFKSSFFFATTYNTLFLNALFITAGMFFSVSPAILLNEVTRKKQKAFQTAMFFPYFISWVVVGQFLTVLLSERFGLVNDVIKSFGGTPVSWYTESSYWPAILTVASVWKGLGYGSVVYLAQIVGFDQEIYEAALIDGAGKWQEIRLITLPMLMPTITLLLLMAIGNVFRSDVQMIVSLTQEIPQLIGSTDVIDTFVLRALRNNGQIGLGAAVGLYQSIMGFVLVLGTNYFVKRRNPDNALF